MSLFFLPPQLDSYYSVTGQQLPVKPQWSEFSAVACLGIDLLPLIDLSSKWPPDSLSQSTSPVAVGGTATVFLTEAK